MGNLYSTNTWNRFDTTSPNDPFSKTSVTLASLRKSQEVNNAAVQTRPGRALVEGIRQLPTVQEKEQALVMEQDTMGTVMSYISALTCTASSPQVITYDIINSPSSSDSMMPSLSSLIHLCCPDEKSAWPEQLSAYYHYRENLTTLDCTVL